MGTTLRVAADLRFSVSVADPADPAHTSGAAGSGHTVEGTLRGDKSALELRLSDPNALVGGAALKLARGLADAVAAHGVTLTVVGPDGPLATLGSVRSTWVQRRLTGSRHMRVGGLRAVLPLLRLRGGGDAAPMLSPIPVPPPTLLPLAPTMRRRRLLPITTTHDPEGGGRPRLVFAPGPFVWPDDPRRIFDLRPDVTTIGSAPTADLRLDGLAEEHAEIRRTAADEFVFVQLSGTHASFLNGERLLKGQPLQNVEPLQNGTGQNGTGPRGTTDGSRRRLLRTGTRVELGQWTLSYYREEFADHGRPYGGRVGGEIGHQRPQPPRKPLRAVPPTS